MKALELNSIDEVDRELNKQQRNENVITGLVIAGGAIILAWILREK